LFELDDLRLEAVDLGFPRVRDLSSLLQTLEASFELGAEVGVGAGAVEGGAVDAGLVGEGLDVASAAPWVGSRRAGVGPWRTERGSRSPSTRLR